MKLLSKLGGYNRKINADDFYDECLGQVRLTPSWCNNTPRHTFYISHFTVFPPFLSKNNDVLQQEIRNENSETKLMKYDMNE